MAVAGEVPRFNEDNVPENNGDKVTLSPDIRAIKAPIIGDTTLTAAGVKGGEISYLPPPPGLPKMHILYGLPKPPRIKGMSDTH